MKALLLIVLLNFGYSVPIYAKRSPANKELAHFVSGEYVLKSGDELKCSQGSFFLRDKNTNIALGPYHGFDLKNRKKRVQGDIPGDTHCVYRSENKMLVKASETELSYTEQRVCNDEIKHTLTKKAFIETGKVSLNFHLKDGSSLKDFNCYWELKKAK